MGAQSRFRKGAPRLQPSRAPDPPAAPARRGSCARARTPCGSASRAATARAAPRASPKRETANKTPRQTDTKPRRRIKPAMPSRLRRLQRSSGSGAPSPASGDFSNASQFRAPIMPTSTSVRNGASTPTRSASFSRNAPRGAEPCLLDRPFDRCELRNRLAARHVHRGDPFLTAVMNCDP